MSELFDVSLAALVLWKRWQDRPKGVLLESMSHIPPIGI